MVHGSLGEREIAEFLEDDDVEASAEIGHGLVEFTAIGTAVKKTVGVGVATPTLPVQAIVSDKDTWIDGDFGFQLDRAN
jgi:hypothetical protein